jgi:plasmid stabilization system protein ParE
VKYKIVIRPEAEADILEAYSWYERQEVGLGEDLIEIIDEALSDLAKRPVSFPILFGITRRMVLRRFPYSIFFTVIGDVVTVTSCAHHKRHPRVWMSRQ